VAQFGIVSIRCTRTWISEQERRSPEGIGEIGKPVFTQLSQRVRLSLATRSEDPLGQDPDGICSFCSFCLMRMLMGSDFLLTAAQI